MARQTTIVNGKRVVITTSAAGKVSVKDAAPKEWEMQAAQVRALRSMPEYGKQFLLAGDMNAERRGPKARAIALATGMTSGEPDLRIYLSGGRIGLIENKAGRGKLSPAQVARHNALTRLGHVVVTVSASTPDEAAAWAVALVRGWLTANDATAMKVAA